MNHWAFVIAAFAVALAGTGGLLLFAWQAMRSAEAKADALRDRR